MKNHIDFGTPILLDDADNIHTPSANSKYSIENPDTCQSIESPDADPGDEHISNREIEENRFVLSNN